MDKIYFSKANGHDKTLAEKVRVALLQRGYEVIEANEPFNGHDQMLSCEEVVFLPKSIRTVNADDSETVIGKGQTEQIEAWCHPGNRGRPSIIVDFSKEEGPIVSEISEYQYDNNKTVKVINRVDYTNYGIVPDDCDDLDMDHFGEVIPGRENKYLELSSSESNSGIHLAVAKYLGLI